MRQFLCHIDLSLQALYLSSVAALAIFPPSNGTNPVEPVQFLSPRLTTRDPPANFAGYWDSYNASGPLVLVTSRSMIPTLNLTDAIVIHSLSNGESRTDAVNAFKGTSIQALLLVFIGPSSTPGLSEWQLDYPAPSGNTYPVYEVSYHQVAEIVKTFFSDENSTEPVIATVSSDPNPWTHSYTVAFPVIGMFVLIANGITTICAVYKLTLCILANGFEVSVGNISLCLIIASCVDRIMYCSFDPFGAYHVFPWFNYMYACLFCISSYPISLAAALLLCLYWLDLIYKKNNRSTAFLDKTFWPFLIWAFAVILTEILVDVMHGYYLNYPPLFYIIGLTYIVPSVFVIFLFIITRIRLEILFRKIRKRDAALDRATLYFSAIIVLIILSAISVGIMTLDTWFWSPKYWWQIWFMFYLCGSALSFVQMLLISAPSKDWSWLLCGACYAAPLGYSPSTDAGSTTTHDTSVTNANPSIFASDIGDDP